MIVAEYTLPNGVRVRIHDDCMAKKGSEEEKRIIEEQRRAAYNILVSAASKGVKKAAGE